MPVDYTIAQAIKMPIERKLKPKKNKNDSKIKVSSVST